MGEVFWTIFCNNSECSTKAGNACSSGLLAIINPDSCINHILIIAADILLLFILLYIFISKISSNKIKAPSQSQNFSTVSIISVTFNAGLALAYFGFGIWTIVEKVNTCQTVLPLHGWLVLLFQGFTWLLLAFTISLKKPHTPHIAITKVCSVLAFFIAVVLCSSSLWETIVDEAVSFKIALNIFYFTGSILFLFSAFLGSYYSKGEPATHDDVFYTPLLGADSDNIGDLSSNNNVTPFAKAALFSSMSFWWLKTINEER